MTPLEIGTDMQSLITDLGKLRMNLKVFGSQKAKAISNYERSIARTIIRLKNGIEYDLDGDKVLNPPTTTAEKIAKGLCWKEKLEAEESEALYKSLIVNIEVIKAQLNAYQSILRYFE